MNLNTLKKSIEKMKKKEVPKYISITVCLLSVIMLIFTLFLNQKIADENKGLTLAIDEISQIRATCVEPYEEEDGKFKINVSKPEENVVSVTVFWKTFFLIADSYSYSFIPTGICSN